MRKNITREQETPEDIVYDTLKRLRNLSEKDAERVVMALATFQGCDITDNSVEDGE